MATVEGNVPDLSDVAFTEVNPLTGELKATAPNWELFSLQAAPVAEGWVTMPAHTTQLRALVPTGFQIVSVSVPGDSQTAVYYSRAMRGWLLCFNAAPGVVRIGVAPADSATLGPVRMLRIDPATPRNWTDSYPSTVREIYQAGHELLPDEKLKVEADIAKTFTYTVNPELDQGENFMQRIYTDFAVKCDEESLRLALGYSQMNHPSEVVRGYLVTGKTIVGSDAHAWVITTNQPKI